MKSSIKNYVTTSFMCILFLSGISIFQSCSSEDEIGLINDQRLTTLEKKYNVSISQEKQISLSQSNLDEIEQEIIKFINYCTIEKTNIELNKTSRNKRLKLKALESVSLTSWVTNLIWLHVDLDLNNNNLTVSSNSTGISIYSYEQTGYNTDYTSGKTSCTYQVHGKFYMTVTKYLLNISSKSTADGTADFSKGTGTISVKVDDLIP